MLMWPGSKAVKNLLRGLLIGMMLMAHWGSAPSTLARPAVIDAAVLRALNRSGDDQLLDVIVTLRDQADFSRIDRPTVPVALQRHAALTQSQILASLRAQPPDQVRSLTSLWIDNSIALSASRQVIFDLARRLDVTRIQLDELFLMPEYAGGPATAAANLTSIGVPAVWQRGITGQGVVVAVLDSGVDMSNADLSAKWRGGSNSWFDPYNEHTSPADLSGHGTQVLGVILGGEADGTPIGVAPGARWIAAKIFNDRGRATHSAIHRALQWVLDPDGDPATADAPQVVNNSWSSGNPGCDSDFAPDLRALRAAGILPVFAAGTDIAMAPANTPEAFAVGALENDTTLLADSARGPANCLNAATVYPQLVAPGADIHTTERSGMFANATGTSLAAAHVSGALALLLSVNPRLSAAEQAALLINTADDLGAHGPDNDYGYGRLNAAALIEQVAPARISPWLMIFSGLGLVLIAASAAVIFKRRHARSQADPEERRVFIDTRWQDLDS